MTFSHRQSESWQRIENLLERDFEQPDLAATRLILGCVAAHRIVEYPPVWMMAVAPSGSMKTVVLESLGGLSSTHFADEVTPQTFISGKLDDKRKKRQAPASLLHRIGEEGILLAADFSTILSMDERNRAKILAQLRRIYDGHFSREFGSEENLQERDWKGRLTFLTGVTPDVDSHYSVFRSLGERFVQVRMPRAGGVQTGLKAMQQRSGVARDLRTAVHALMEPILSQRCFSCHGGDAGSRQANLRLDTPDGVFSPRSNGKPVIVKGDPDGSLLFQRISADNPALRMPPTRAGAGLTPAEIKHLETAYAARFGVSGFDTTPPPRAEEIVA